MTAKKLTPKQKLFVREYLVDMCATSAAVRAGYSERTARQSGYLNMSNPAISALIARAMEKRSQKIELTADLVLAGLLKEAQAEGEGTTHSARVAAWRALGEYLKLFVQKHEHAHEHSGTVTLTVEQVQTEVDAIFDDAKLLTAGDTSTKH